MKYIQLIAVTLFPILALGCNERKDFSKDGLVLPGSKVEKLADGFTYTEGPAVDAEGNVFFADLPNNRIYKWSVAEKILSIFLEDSFGISGLFFDKDDNLYACQRDKGRIVSIAPNGKETVLASEYNGNPFYKANDLWIDPQGGVYFTHRDDNPPPQEQYGGHIFYITPNDKQVIRVADDYQKPNGIIGTPDGKTLYVSDRGTKKIYSYNIFPDGTLSEKQFFANVGSDGMTLDEKGNLYVTTDMVHVFNPAGKEITIIQTPERPSNLCFGGQDRKTLFITAHTGFYSIKMSVAGMAGPKR